MKMSGTRLCDTPQTVMTTRAPMVLKDGGWDDRLEIDDCNALSTLVICLLTNHRTDVVET